MSVDIKSRLPTVLAEMEENKQYANACNMELEKSQAELQIVFDNGFIESLNEYGCARMESIMKLNSTTDDLATRRLRILGKNNEQSPYDYNRFIQILDSLCGKENYDITVDYPDYKVSVAVKLEAKSLYKALVTTCNNVLPANMIRNVYLKYNTHRVLSAYTHNQLHAYTHYQLREDVL